MLRYFLPVLTLLTLTACSPSREPQAIASAALEAPAMIGRPAEAKPLRYTIPDHPYLAQGGRSYMHADGFSSDVHPGPAPLGHSPRVISRDGSPLPGGSCPIHTVTTDGKLVVLCANLFYFELQLLEPQSLEMLARFELPPRPSTYAALLSLDPSKIMTDTSGAYFYLDNRDRVVYADSRQHIRRIAHREASPGQWEFYDADDWDLSAEVPHDCVSLTHWNPTGECDPITGVMPDYNGLIWWMTRNGRLGTLNPETGSIHAYQLDGEEIQNGASVATDGVYIVSDHAMYRFEAGAQGQPRIGWREVYDRGSSRKVGSINQGSGTTPTLLGEDYVTITDNADEQINLLVYRRQQAVVGERLVCKVPLFEAGASATDNTMVALERSIIIENNHGYISAFQQKDWSAVTGGISRIDVRADESGCDTVWTSSEKAPSVVPKMSAATGLVYFYTFEPQSNGENAWYLMALDFETGQTVFKIRTGAGSGYDNNWSPITLAPDGTAYVGTFEGLIAIKDSD